MLAAKIKAAHETRQKYILEARALLDGVQAQDRDLTADEDVKFEELMKIADAAKAEAEALQKREQREAVRNVQIEGAERELYTLRQHGINRDRFPASAAGEDPASPAGRALANSPFLNAELYDIAIGGWVRNQHGVPVSNREMQAARACGMNLEGSGVWVPLPRNYNAVRHHIRAALSTTSGGAGGYATKPEGFAGSLETAMLLVSGILQVAEIIRTESGEPMGWPTANDTGNKGRQVGEGAAVTQLDPTFGSIKWGAYKYTSDELLCPTELIEDASFDLAPKLGEMCGERLGRIINEKGTIGTGAATMRGIVTAAPVGKTAAATGALTADELLDFVHSVGRAYRVGAGWMFNDATCLALRKLKDAENRYIWQQALSGGAPDTLLTYPITINDDMASLAASADVAVFGQLSKYKVRQVGAVRLYRLVERHRENDQEAFLAFTRADGNLLDAGTNPVKKLRMAAA